MAVAANYLLTNYQSFRQADGIAARIGRTIRLWRSRIRDRRSFDYIDDRSLRDLGVSRWEFDREIAKPFWRD